MALKIFNSELAKLTASTPIDLFEVDTTMVENNALPHDLQVMMFHNYASESYFPVYFGGVRYPCVPIKITNSEIKGDGTTLPVPRITIGNADGTVSYYMKQCNQLIGAKITRKRTFAKFLDGTTWNMPANENPFGTPSPDGFVLRDGFYIGKVVVETPEGVEFEGVAPMELYDIKLPRRRMFYGTCTHEYRNSTGCAYAGRPQADASNKFFLQADAIAAGSSSSYVMASLTDRGEWSPYETYNRGDYVFVNSNRPNEENTAPRKFYFVANQNGLSGQNNKPMGSSKWIADNCSRRIPGCLARFDKSNLPFGAFPALIRVEFEN